MSVTVPDPQPDVTADAPVEPAAAVEMVTPAPDPAPELTGPWAKDLEATFADESTRGQVDAFLRGHVQPHVTRLETRASELQSAGALLDDLRQDPATTFVALGRELYGDEAAQQLQAALGLAAEEQEPVTPPPAAGQELDPRVQELLDERELDRYNKRVEELGVIPEVFHPLVAAYGDIDAAHAAYPAHLEALKAHLGTPISEEVPDPPAVIDSQVQAQTTPPVIERPQTLDEAFDEYFAAQATAPQTVGSV